MSPLALLSLLTMRMRVNRILLKKEKGKKERKRSDSLLQSTESLHQLYASAHPQQSKIKLHFGLGSIQIVKGTTLKG